MISSVFSQINYSIFHKIFGDGFLDSKRKRSLRFLEEALELIQSTGLEKADVDKMVAYVFDRPVEPEIWKEVGGTYVTLDLLCQAHGLSLEECAWKEVGRTISRIDIIKAKHDKKPVEVRQ